MTSDPLVGREIDGYRILEVLGRGGMGVVYRAENISLGRMEALKVIAPSLVEDVQFLRRFKMEAQALAKIHHPNIVTVFTQRESEIGVYLTMEYVEGETLAELLEREGTLPWEQVMSLMEQLLGAFSYAHDRGIIHRDIKPRNIMLTGEGTVKVMDFGLAKFYQQHDLTQTQGVSGTLYYMSPEQIKASRPLDQRSDIFSLGMTMYEMLSGRLPFDKTESQYTIQRSIVEGRIPRPEQFNADVPRPLADIVMHALSTEVAQRYQNAREMLDALQAYDEQLDEPIPKGKPGRRSRAPAGLQRWGRLPVYLGALLLLGGLGVWALASGPFAPAEEDSRVTSEQPDEQLVDLQSMLSGIGEIADEDGLPATDELEPAPEGAEDIGAATDPGDERVTETTDEETDPPETPTDTDVGLEDDASDEVEADPETDGEEEVAEEAVPDEVAPDLDPAEEEEPVEEAPTAEEQITLAVDEITPQLKEAIVANEWTEVPLPLARFYQELLDPIYSRHNVHDAEIVVRAPEIDGSTATVFVRVFIEYQQRGREGRQSVPLPATWVWVEEDGMFEISRVEAD